MLSYWLIIILLLSLWCQGQELINSTIVPTCAPNGTSLLQPTERIRLSVISHYSIVATFINNPESAAREAASLLNVELEWNRHVVSSSEKMIRDINEAVKNKVDGIIVTIPNDDVFKAVQEAQKSGIPIIVYNVGMEYAKTLGLSRVLQSDRQSSEMMATELKRRNCSRPLGVQITSSGSLDEQTFGARARGISQFLGHAIDVLSVYNMNNAVDDVVQAFDNGTYDSLISLGGLAGVDLVTAASMRIDDRHPEKKLGVAFYDVGSKGNMSDIFARFNDAFGISQLPYYQASLPVFIMYIWVTTSSNPFLNKTITTGPNLVTKDTYTDYVSVEGHSIIPNEDLGAEIGAVLTNTEGDTYQAGIMAGVYDLATKLNWTISLTKEEGLVGNSSIFIQHVKALVDRGIRGLVLQSSDPAVLNYTVHVTDEHNIPLAVIGGFWEDLNILQYNATGQQTANVVSDSATLAASVAQSLVQDEAKKPVCFSSHTPWKTSRFCDKVYVAYKHQFNNAMDIPPLEDFRHLINLSTITAMEIDFQNTIDSLQQRGYNPDRLLRGLLDNNTIIYSAVSQYDQIRAFLDGRIDRVWHYNTFANGFLALLDILLSKTSPHRPWKTNTLSVPEVKEICKPGQYYINLSDSPYCVFRPYDVSSTSFRCVACPPGTFTSESDQAVCKKCPYGTFSGAGAAHCISCDEDESDHSSQSRTQCIAYFSDQAAKRRKIFVGVFVPIGIIILGLLVAFLFWRHWRHKKKLPPNSPSESTWLLSLDELMRPPIQHMSSLPSPSSLANSSPGLTPSDAPLLTANGKIEPLNPTPGVISSQTDAARTPELVTSGAVLVSSVPLKIPQRASMLDSDMDSVSEVEGGDPQQQQQNQARRRHSDTTAIRDYFTIATTHHDTSSLLYFPEKHDRRLIRAIGFHRNLPVFIKQIGYRRVHLNQTAYHEISLVKMARHSKLVEFIGLCIEPTGTFIVEEYCSKGTLFDVLKNPDLDLTWIFRFSLINDLISGLEFLHRSKFLFHGCLTSQACVITGRWELKITDYGLYKIRESQYDPVTVSSLSKRYPKFHHRTSMPASVSRGSPVMSGDYDSPMHIVPHIENLLWLAPESVLPTSFDVWVTYSNKKTDIYSLGIIMNEIVTRAQPYKKDLLELGESNYEAVFDRIKNKEVLPDMLASDQDMYVGKVNEIIIACWRREPTTRPSIGQVKNRIKTIDPHISGSDNVVDNLALLLEKYANDMENLVRKRTANLQQRTLELEEERARTDNLLKDLKEAKEVAEAAAASKQNFLANMSHEIRTPMNAVIGMSRILMESNLPAELHDCAETIESSGNHLMAIIDDILDYSKIESGKLTLEHRRMDLIFVFESAIKLVAPNYTDKGIVLWNTFDPGVATAVYGDVVRLRQVLLNILSNALKFTKEGYVNIHVSCIGSAPTTPDYTFEQDSIDNNNEEEKKGLLADSLVDERGGGSVRTESLLISIHDTGIGIQKDKVDKLFQTFSQVDASTTRNFGGTGLGLAISRKLTRMMGGEMWFESDYGQGSTFYFTVKLLKQSDSPTYGSVNCLNEITDLCHSALIIVDHQYLRKAWKEVLSSIGLSHAKVVPFSEAEDEIRKQHKKGEHFSLLAIDEEFEVIQEMGPEPTSSQAVLSALQSRFSCIRSIPTLCMRDIRNQRQERLADDDQQLLLPQLSKHAPVQQQQETPTPRSEGNNPFDSVNTVTSERILYITKPVKATKLFASMLKVLKPPEIGSDDELPVMTSDAQSLQQQTTGKGINNCPIKGGTAGSNVSRSNSVKRTRSDGKGLKGRARSNTIVSTLSASSSTSSGRPFSQITGSVRSLLVDDNPVNQKVVTRMLSRLGIHPEVAINGKEACDIVRKSKEGGQEKPIDLIFMDIWMPEMNGFEASEYIRSNLSESPVHPYIIAMTACVMPGDKEKCLNAGMNGYVSKPVRKDELEASLHTYTQVIVSESSEDSATMETPIEETEDNPLLHQRENTEKSLPDVTVTVDGNERKIHDGNNNT
ncbi:hypothetical protein BDA99DRAFT_601329 [Phascolomyces articulosus]|uniref:histidine kinase n=1 Tax=Phascolomyces articulosus TaxID=60185 RepID=A0AAD5PJ60_9FUNG|nr:hypothetical protein BDA99DRAFT_601329 [Phascolomyces articulosus]